MSPEDEVFRLISGYRASQMVALAVELRVPDLVASGPKTAAEVAHASGSHEPSLLRLLGGLCALGVLTADGHGRFAETPLSACLRSGEKENAFARMSSREGYAAWAQLGYSVRTGKPAYEVVHGRTRWEHLAQDPDAIERFNSAMAATAELDGKALANACDLSQVGKLVDVGGGRGALMAAVLTAQSRMQGVILDLSAGLEGARAHLEAWGVAERCRLVTGSFFEAVPTGGDAYVLRWILHDWDDERAARIIASCAEAMPPHARLLVIERLLPERFETTGADLRVAMADLHMMVVLGGRERSEDEFRDLFAAAGLELGRKAPLPSGTWLLEARKV